MKKVIAIMMLALAVLIGGVSAEAKTPTKKKSKSTTSAIKFGTMYDGYPDVGGHTYTTTLQGAKFQVRFGPYTGSNSVVYLKATYRGHTEEEINNWYYEGNGIIMFYMNAGEPVYFQITNGGKELQGEYYTLKAIR